MLTQSLHSVYYAPGRPKTADPAVLYVGETSASLKDRRRAHISDARAGKDHLVQRWIREHGADAFQLKPYALVESKQAARFIESALVKKLKPPLNGSKDGGPGSHAYAGTGPVRTVIDVDTGERWPSIRACARAIDRGMINVQHALRGVRETCAGRRLAFAEA